MSACIVSFSHNQRLSVSWHCGVCLYCKFSLTTTDIVVSACIVSFLSQSRCCKVHMLNKIGWHLLFVFVSLCSPIFFSTFNSIAVWNLSLFPQFGPVFLPQYSYNKIKFSLQYSRRSYSRLHSSWMQTIRKPPVIFGAQHPWENNCFVCHS